MMLLLELQTFPLIKKLLDNVCKGWNTVNVFLVKPFNFL